MSSIDEIRSRMAEADGMRSAALKSARELRDSYLKMAREVEAQFPGLSVKMKRRTSPPWTDAQRALQSQRMKDLWRSKKGVGR